MKTLAASLSAMLVVAGCAGASTSSSPATSNSPGQVIPMKYSSDGGGVITQVSVGGGALVPIIIDTGSTGLRIFEQSVGSNVQAQKDVKITETYGDATEYDGYLASAIVKVGSATTSSPIDIHVVNSVSCDPSVKDQSACEGSIQDTIKDGYYGIMGINLTPNGQAAGMSVYSPLPSLEGFKTYTIDATGCLEDEGTCSITSGLPSSKPTSEVQMPELSDLESDGTPEPSPPDGISYWNQIVKNCWAIKGNAVECAPSLMDSGTSAMRFASGTLDGLPTTGGSVPDGTVELEWYGSAKNGEPLWTMENGSDADDVLMVDTDDDNLCSKIDPDQPMLSCQPDVITGLPFWLNFKVGYDLKNGLMTHYKVDIGSTPSAD